MGCTLLTGSYPLLTWRCLLWCLHCWSGQHVPMFDHSVCKAVFPDVKVHMLFPIFRPWPRRLTLSSFILYTCIMSPRSHLNASVGAVVPSSLLFFEISLPYSTNILLQHQLYTEFPYSKCGLIRALWRVRNMSLWIHKVESPPDESYNPICFTCHYSDFGLVLDLT